MEMKSQRQYDFMTGKLRKWPKENRNTMSSEVLLPFLWTVPQMSKFPTLFAKTIFQVANVSDTGSGKLGITSNIPQIRDCLNKICHMYKMGWWIVKGKVFSWGLCVI